MIHQAAVPARAGARPSVPPPGGAGRPRHTGGLLRPRVMSVATAVGIGAVLALPATALVNTTMGWSSEMIFLPGIICLFVVPVVGVMLLAAVVVNRAASDGRRLLLAILSLPAVLLIGPALDVGMELFVATRLDRLDALAEDVLRAVAEGEAPERLDARFLDRGRPLGVSHVAADESGLVFHLSVGFFAPSLLYVSPTGGPVPAREGLRPMGGSWYQFMDYNAD